MMAKRRKAFRRTACGAAKQQRCFAMYSLQ
jgi:hypothetical protein